MKTLLGIAVVVCLGGVSTDAQFGGRLPSGSYSRTCSDISMVGSVLTANCKDQNGETIKSRLYVRDCWGDVTNELGELVCQSRRLPEGSYSQTCTACATAGSALRCTCRDTKQNSIRTSLDLASCRWGSGITNKDGHLQCD
jgi:CVNH domain